MLSNLCGKLFLAGQVVIDNKLSLLDRTECHIYKKYVTNVTNINNTLRRRNFTQFSVTFLYPKIWNCFKCNCKKKRKSGQRMKPEIAPTLCIKKYQDMKRASKSDSSRGFFASK